MATGRDDFVIAFRSAILKKKDNYFIGKYKEMEFISEGN